MHRITQFAALILITSVTAPAQSIAAYPSRSVRLVVPSQPGGASDILARDIAPKLTTQLGKQVAIDNLSKANGVQGFDGVAKAPADGHTLLLGSATGLAVNPQLFPKIPYDAVRSFTPISLLARTPMVLIAILAILLAVAELFSTSPTATRVACSAGTKAKKAVAAIAASTRNSATRQSAAGTMKLTSPRSTGMVRLAQ